MILYHKTASRETYVCQALAIAAAQVGAPARSTAQSRRRAVVLQRREPCVIDATLSIRGGS
jgi:hypothetical protein